MMFPAGRWWKGSSEVFAGRVYAARGVDDRGFF